MWQPCQRDKMPMDKAIEKAVVTFRGYFHDTQLHHFPQKMGQNRLNRRGNGCDIKFYKNVENTPTFGVRSGYFKGKK